jgi:hypothetical protein
MFEKASRLKVRFDTGKGQLTIEDLWDLPLTSNTGRVNLDDIAIGLNKQLKNDDDVSFVVKDRKSDSVVQLKFDIIKHIIEVRLAENEANAKARQNAEQKQRILQLIADKQDEALKGKSLEELHTMITELK